MVVFSGLMFFFFKQKTAYEMRISDWSSDVCSSDLPCPRKPGIFLFRLCRAFDKGGSRRHGSRSCRPPCRSKDRRMTNKPSSAVCYAAEASGIYMGYADRDEVLGDRKSTRLNSSH